MSRRRWWQGGPLSVEKEQAEFEAERLRFELDQERFEQDEVVVFRGDLRLGRRRTAASVIYPPTYGQGGHPDVVASGISVGRHRTPDGHLCLDHPVFGTARPMTGVEAVLRAERLWWLWEKEPEKLRTEEVDAPDPHSNYTRFVSDSAVAFCNVDLDGATGGYFRLRARSVNPLRGVVTEVRVARPSPRVITPAPALPALAGALELNGAWLRVGTPPPHEAGDFADWLKQHHSRFLQRQLTYAVEAAQSNAQPDTPALIGVVYEDEGPGRDETHDAWAVFYVHPERLWGGIARPFYLRDSERWIRQPQLQPLGRKRVTVVGLGALGSPIADLLTRAGVSSFELLDPDYISVGNRVRHALGTEALGLNKAFSMGARLADANPWVEARALPARVGAVGAVAEEGDSQRLDDALFIAMQGSDLIVNASANGVVSAYLSRIGADAGKPVLHTYVSPGAWGARVLLQRPGQSGCWQCLALAQTRPEAYSTPVVVPEVSSDPASPQAVEQGCADATFTGPGFDLTAAAVAATRIAVQALGADDCAYPPFDADLATLTFRTADDSIPSTVNSLLPPHPECTTCQQHDA